MSNTNDRRRTIKSLLAPGPGSPVRIATGDRLDAALLPTGSVKCAGRRGRVVAKTAGGLIAVAVEGRGRHLFTPGVLEGA